MKRTLILLLAVAAMFVGCMNPVPSNDFKGSLGGVPFQFHTRKQNIATNIDLTVASVTATGTNYANLHIGSISSLNDPQVIDKSYAGQIGLETARWNGMNSFMEKALQGAAAGITKGGASTLAIPPKVPNTVRYDEAPRDNFVVK